MSSSELSSKLRASLSANDGLSPLLREERGREDDYAEHAPSYSFVDLSAETIAQAELELVVPDAKTLLPERIRKRPHAPADLAGRRDHGVRPGRHDRAVAELGSYQILDAGGAGNIPHGFQVSYISPGTRSVGSGRWSRYGPERKPPGPSQLHRRH
jgi:hypothetical protein